MFAIGAALKEQATEAAEPEAIELIPGLPEASSGSTDTFRAITFAHIDPHDEVLKQSMRCRGRVWELPSGYGSDVGRNATQVDRCRAIHRRLE